MMTAMSILRARVKNGRLVLDEPTDLPEGMEVELVPADVKFVPHPDDETEVRAAAEEAKRREKLLTLTSEELKRWTETGEWPESLG